MIVQNIQLLCSTLSLNTQRRINTGWFGQQYYGKNAQNNLLNNLSSDGTINCNLGGGGIVGIEVVNGSASLIVSNCYTTSNIIGTGAGGIVGGIYCITTPYNVNISISINNCYSTGNIICRVADWFGYNTNATSSITNCYSTGNISGLNAGGICGAEVGYYNISANPNINITNCYSLGIISNGSGGIVGGTEGTIYYNTPIVTITNCYCFYGLIKAQSLQITPTITNCYEPFGTWSDTNAVLYLLNTPTYSLTCSLVNPTGDFWAYINHNSNSIPWLFSTFGYSPYTTELTTTFTQTIDAGNKSVSALDIVGHDYTIISINNELVSKYPQITMNSSTGQIEADISTRTGNYLIKVLQQSNYTLTNFNLVVVSRPTISQLIECNKFCVGLKKNNINVLALNKLFSKNLLFRKYFVQKDPAHGSISLDSKGKLVYKPYINYTGKYKFILGVLNKINELVTEKIFIIKISN